MNKFLKSFREIQSESKIAYLKKHYIRITDPKALPKKFSEIIGMDSEREIFGDAVKFLKNLRKYQSDPLRASYSRFLLSGASGSGKTLLVASIAKETGRPLFTVDLSTFVSFQKKSEKLLQTLFEVVSAFKKGCVIHIQNYPSIKALSPERLTLFSNQLAQRIAQNTNAVIVLSTTEENIALPKVFFSPNVFYQNKVVQIMPPTLPTRKALFEEYFRLFNAALAPDVSSERLARSTFGMYPKDIEFIVRDTILYAERKGHDLLTSKDFNDVMITLEAGQTHYKMTDKERLSTARHEAGHVIAAYFSNPYYRFGRVEITPRTQSLGLTQEEAGEDKFSRFKSDYEKEIIYSLGGKVAEQIFYHENTSGVTSDLAYASSIALAMAQNFGMYKEIGPLYVDDECGFYSAEIVEQTEKIASEYLKELEEKTLAILTEHRRALEALAAALVEHEVLMGDEIKKIILAAEAEEKQ